MSSWHARRDVAFGQKSLKDKIMVTPLGVGKFKEGICKNDGFPKDIYTLILFSNMGNYLGYLFYAKFQRLRSKNQS